ncbi:MAG: DedA family protein [Candidatus Altiarchaeales archaeon]|nr:MAG: DedA family protein [Candidatus Altiarchaeales archaeon]
MFEHLREISESLIISNGFFGIFILSTLESFIFPVPTAVIITTATALKLNTIYVVIIATIGSVIGAIIGYYIGMKGGRPVLIHLFNEKKINRVENMFDRYGVYAVGIAALTPIPFKLFTISAGVGRMDIIPFVLICIPTRFMQFLIFALFGSLLSQFLFF